MPGLMGGVDFHATPFRMLVTATYFTTTSPTSGSWL
jgi:hypothetical protein